MICIVLQVLLLPGVGLLQTRDIYLFHLEHRLHYPTGFFVIGIAQELAKDFGDNLP